MFHKFRRRIPMIVDIVAVASVAIGAGLIFMPAGLIVGGIALLFVNLAYGGRE